MDWTYYWKNRGRTKVYICPQCGEEQTPLELDRGVVETKAFQALGKKCKNCGAKH